KRGTIDDQPGLLLRVESDQPKVQIMTMHAAKGLEFPVVFILGWFTSTDFETFRRYHVPEPGPAGTRKWRIDLSGSDEAKRLSAHEEQDEERRLFYVAMTRAIGRVYMPLGIPEKNPKKAGPIYEYLREGIEKAFPGLTAGPTGNHAGVALRLTEPADGAGPAPSEPGISARTVSSQLVLEPPPERIPTRDRLFIPVNSFSSLASRGGPEPVALEDDRETTGATIEFLPCDEPPDAEEAAGAAAEPDIGLPAGARTGTLFHALMEQLDYEAVMAAKTPSDLLAEGTPSAELIGRLFRRYPIRRLHDPADAARLVELAWNTLRTPLEFLGGQPLAACRERRHEMVFWMPAPGAAARELLGTTVSKGLLTGALDLVIRYNNAYHIIDFKTNRSRAGYGGTALDGIMEEHRYRLQYLLYGVALRRLLRGPEQRTEATPLAGAGYLFVRGMTGAKGSPGVFHGDLSDAILDRFERETLPALLGKRTGAGGEA
ncbi:MAG TPA: 3'-5' exonuclease, partial [Candidatus Ozemobacteraceae bacterium]|nr:3'-5' exonuclease [Candidatus Ozemobacteraceae bacterium]